MSSYFGGGGAITAHNGLTGLTNDDHPQYSSHKLQRSYGYAAGGQDQAAAATAKVEKYDDVADSWTVKTSLNITKTASQTSLNGYGYSSGGDNTGGGAGITDDVEKYDDVADSWTTKTSLVAARKDLNGFSLNGFIYANVGFVAAGTTARSEKYDDVANTWTTKGSLSAAKYASTGYTLNGYGFVAGGYISAYQTTNEKYDDVANAWATRGILSIGKADSSSFYFNGYGYSIGGDISGGNTARVEKYDIIVNSWTTKTDTSLARSSVYGMPLNGYGYVAGGTGYTARTEKYDDVADSWTTKTAMSLAKAYCGGTGISQGQMTETKYLSPEIVNILRSVSYRAMIYGSFNTSATSSGYCNIVHSLGTAPVAAWAIPVRTAANVGAISLDLKGLGGTNLTFVVSSCPITTFSPTTSSISVNFVWGAKP